MRRSSSKMIEALDWLRYFPPPERARVVEAFVEEHYTFGEVIVREGDEAEAYFILTEGKARVLKREEGGREVALDVLRPGQGFGEAALLEGGASAATVRASGDVTVLRLEGDAFHALLDESPDLRAYVELQARHRSLETFLRQVSRLRRASVAALKALLEGLEPVEVAKGATIIREGDPAGPLFIIEKGRFQVYRREGGQRRDLAFLRDGDFFGERSMLEGAPRSATVRAVADGKLLRLPPERFHALCEEHGELKAIFEERLAQYQAEVEARLPLDFHLELLPSDSNAFAKVGEDQLGPGSSTPTPRAAEAARPSTHDAHDASTKDPKPGAPSPVDPAETVADLPAEALAGVEPPEAEPLVSPPSLWPGWGGRGGRIRFVRQIDEMDCGAAALGMVCRWFGRDVSLARIRQLCHTSVDGTSLRALCTAADQLGLAARAVKLSKRHLADLKPPAIVHWEGNHWVVVLKVSRRGVRIADPAVGLRWVGHAEFEEKWSGYAALFDYTAAFESAPEEAPTLGWVLPFFRPFAGVLGQVLLLAVVASGLQMLLPVFTQVIVDRVMVDQSVSLLNVILIAMLAAMGIMTLTTILQQYILSYVAVQIDAGVLDFLMRRMLALPMSYFNSRRTGDIQRRLSGAQQIRQFLVRNVVGGALSAVQLVVALGLMFLYSPVLLGIFLLTVPLYAVLMVFSARILRPLFQGLEEGFGRYRSHQVDAIKGIEAVKAASAERYFRETMLEEFTRIANQQFRSQFIGACYDGLLATISFLTTILFLYVGGRMVMEGQLTIGAFVAFHALVAMGYRPITQVLGLWDDYQLIVVLLNRLQDIFSHPPEQGGDRSRLAPVPTLEGRVEARGLTFRYGGPEAPAILQEIDFEVAPGQMVAIVGRSGSGKTTLAKCLAGLLEPSEGSILYDNLEMKTLDYRQLRRHVGMVLQENYIFADTVLVNIALGDAEPDLDRAMWAARLANADDFVSRLPLGYETKIGETGLALSGGQRQRIAIARALYNQPAILILDEATSALDTESERAIQENLRTVLTGRTAFVIAHRLSTIRDADTILVVEQGRIVERGSHDELMARRGLYFFLCSRQLDL